MSSEIGNACTIEWSTTIRRKFSLIAGGQFLTLLVFVALPITAMGGTVTIRVLPDGAAAEDPTEGGVAVVPTIADAVAKLRQLRADNPAGTSYRILIANGIHRLTEPAILQASDSGTAEAPLLIEGEDAGRTIVSGSAPLTATPTLEPSSVDQRVREATRARLLTYKVPELVAAKWQKLSPMGYAMPNPAGGMPTQVTINGQPSEQARWPAEGYVHVRVTGDPANAQLSLSTPPPQFAGQELQVMAYGYWGNDWSTQWLASALYANGRLYVSGPPPHYGFKDGQRVYFSGAPEFLGAPGQWLYDAATHLLLLVPPTSGPPPTVEVSLAPQLLVMHGISHVRIRSLTFESSRMNLLDASSVTDVAVSSCRLLNAGGRAFVLNDSTNSGITQSEIRHSAAGAVSLVGGSRTSLTPGNDFVTDSRILNFGRLLGTYEPGISISGVGNVAAHNEIAYSPHIAIYYAGNDHMIDSNVIHDVARETDDVGAIMTTGRDWTEQGTIIKDNFIYRITGVDREKLAGQDKNGATAIYLDDSASGVTVTGNTIAFADRAVLVGGGFSDTVSGNLFVEVAEGISIDDRGTTFRRAGILAPDGPFQSGLTRYQVTKPPYSARYPELAALGLETFGIPRDNNLSSNITVGGTAVVFRMSAEHKDLIEASNNASLPNVAATWKSGQVPQPSTGPSGYELATSSEESVTGFKKTNPLAAGPRSVPN